MKQSQLHAVGFDAGTPDKLVKAAFKAGVRGVRDYPGYELIGAYEDPSGARLALSHRKGQQAISSAALKSETTHHAQIVRFSDLLCRAAVYGAGEEDGLAAEFIALIDDPMSLKLQDLRDRHQFNIVPRLQLSALAMDINVFADEPAFRASPKSSEGGVAVAADALISPSLLALQAAAISPAEASPALAMAATVETVEIRTNRLTGVDFQVARLTNRLNWTCAIPLDWPVTTGNLVYGVFYATVSTGTWDQ